MEEPVHNAEGEQQAKFMTIEQALFTTKPLNCHQFYGRHYFEIVNKLTNKVELNLDLFCKPNLRKQQRLKMMASSLKFTLFMKFLNI